MNKKWGKRQQQKKPRQNHGNPLTTFSGSAHES